MSVNSGEWKQEKTDYGWTQVMHQSDDFVVRYRAVVRGRKVPRQYHTLSPRFFYVLVGYGKYTDHEGVTYHIRPGDRITVPAEESFSFEASFNYDLVLLETYPVRPGDEVVFD